MRVRLGPAHPHHAGRHNDERGQRTDVHQLEQHVDVDEAARERGQQSEEPRPLERGAVLVMHVAEELREQAVTAHRVADARLAVQLHQHHRGHADQRAEVDDHRQPVHAGLQDHAGHRRVDELRELLIRHHAGHDERHHDVQDRGDDQRIQDATRQRPVRVDGLLGRRRHRVEADEAEEHDRRGRHDAIRLRRTGLELVDAVRRERLPVGRVDIPDDAHDEQHDDRELDEHHDVVGLLRLVDADRQHPGDEQHDHETGKIEVCGRIGVGAVRGGQLDRQMQSEPFEQLVEIAAPSGGHRGRLQRVLQNQVPADHERDQFPEREIGVRVCRAGNRRHRREFGIAQAGEAAADRGQQERHHQRRAGGQRALAGEYEDAGADDRPDAQHRQVERVHRAFERGEFGDKLIHRFLAK